MQRKKYALISVFDKDKISLICKTLNKYNIGLLSTGSTAKEIIRLGFKCKKISKLTKFAEILDGRVKTLHPKIHSSILFKRNNLNHKKTFQKLKFPTIDFVIINLYPFEKALNSKSTREECIEMIDIGGPALIRSASKNFEWITTISNKNQYKSFIKNLVDNNGNTSLDFRKKMCQKAFNTTSKYDRLISNWLLKNKDKNNKIKELKYGENPNQNSKYISINLKNSIFKMKIHGKELGYNNILDIDAGIHCINEFTEPTCVIIKHNNPCAVSSNFSIINAFKNALTADKVSTFGGIVILNKNVNLNLAKKINKQFFEIIAAKKFNKDALKILKKKKNLILLDTSKIKINKQKESKTVIGGTLIQDQNLIRINKNRLINVSKQNSNSKALDDLLFALRVCKHVKSNAIVLVKNKTTIGIGAGQMSRIDSTKIALLKSKELRKQNTFVAASDAFFPFIDGISLLIKNKCSSLVQPRGSINDKKIIDYANNKNFPLYFINFRLFKH